MPVWILYQAILICLMLYNLFMSKAIADGRILPSHMPLDVWEVYARLVLQRVDYGTYSHLFHGDKPDLFDDDLDLGVEVTRAVSPENEEANSLYVRLRNKKEEPKREQLLERIEQLGGKVSEWGLLGPSGTDNFDLAIRSFKTKIDRLNSDDFRSFGHNHLFIISNVLAVDCMLIEFLKRIEERNNGDATFERVVVSVPGNNIVFDLVNHAFEEHPFTRNEQYEIAREARVIAVSAIRERADK